jgi:hypothetical protein
MNVAGARFETDMGDVATATATLASVLGASGDGGEVEVAGKAARTAALGWDLPAFTARLTRTLDDVLCSWQA